VLPLTFTGKVAVVAILAGATLQPAATLRGPAGAVASGGHKLYGTVQSLAGSTLVIRTRTGQVVTVDGAQAASFVRLRRNRPVVVRGTRDTTGVIHAVSVWRVNADPTHWPPDR